MNFTDDYESLLLRKLELATDSFAISSIVTALSAYAKQRAQDSEATNLTARVEELERRLKIAEGTLSIITRK